MRKHGWFRPHVRGLTAISSTTLREGGGWWLAGSQLDLDFANDRSFNRKTGYQASPNGLLTYTSPSPKMVYGADGVLGYAPHNLLVNSAWAGALVGDDWTPTGWTVTSSTGAATSAVSANSANDLSIRFQTSATRETVGCSFSAVGGVTYRISFDIEAMPISVNWNNIFTTGLIGSAIVDYNGTGTNGNIPPTAGMIGTRVYIDFTPVSTGTVSARLGAGTSANNTGDITLARPMVTTLPTSDYTYLRSATAAAVYSLPIDHDPITFEPLGVLIEEQRTNLLTYSQEFDNAAWSKSATTITANAAVAPNGTTTADLLSSSAASAQHLLAALSGPTVTSGVTYTGSFFLKKGVGATAPDWVQITFSGASFGTVQYGNFNLNTGVVGSVGAGTVATIEDAGNGWYRCAITFAATATADGSPIVLFTNNNDGLGRAPSYVDATTSDVYVWGAQLEAGAFATSYIQTGSAQVTRASDNIKLLTSAFNFSGATSTILAESDVDNLIGTHHVFSLHDGSNNERCVLRSIDAAMNYAISDGGVLQASNNVPGTVQARQMQSVAFAFAVNDIALSMDGGSITSDTSATLPTVTTLSLGASYYTVLDQLNGHIKRIVVWNTRKSNAELQVLSA